MRQVLFQSLRIRQIAQVLKTQGIRQRKRTCLCSAQTGQMRSASEPLAHFVSHRADVTSSRDAHNKLCAIAGEASNFESQYLDSRGLQRYCLALSRGFVSWLAINFLRGVGRRHLLHVSLKKLRACSHLLERQLNIARFKQGSSLSIIGVRRKPETDGARISLVQAAEELCEACVLPQKQRQDARGHGIQRAQVADRRFPRETANFSHHVVGGHSRRFINY